MQNFSLVGNYPLVENPCSKPLSTLLKYTPLTYAFFVKIILSHH